MIAAAFTGLLVMLVWNSLLRTEMRMDAADTPR